MSSPDNARFALNPELDVDDLASRFAANRRLQVADFLAPDSASLLHEYLEHSDRWRHLFNARDRTFEVPRGEWETMPEAKRAEILQLIDQSAAYDFQYQYDTIRVAESAQERVESNTSLDQFAHFLSSGPVLGVLARIVGADDLVFADCQATTYRAGDFLTPHNDELDGMHRRIAYVLSLTGNWLPRWGGLLHFVDDDGGIAETITPRFNALSLFTVGQSHYVSQMASYAPLPRISVTGWLRTQVPG